MPLFIDIHRIDGGLAVEDMAVAHLADLKTQAPHGVHYLRYWVAESDGRVFCLVDAPDADAAARVHRDGHGLVAEAIYRVVEGT
jgi:hypothetical protein